MRGLYSANQKNHWSENHVWGKKKQTQRTTIMNIDSERIWGDLRQKIFMANIPALFKLHISYCFFCIKKTKQRKNTPKCESSLKTLTVWPVVCFFFFFKSFPHLDSLSLRGYQLSSKSWFSGLGKWKMDGKWKILRKMASLIFSILYTLIIHVYISLTFPFVFRVLPVLSVWPWEDVLDVNSAKFPKNTVAQDHMRFGRWSVKSVQDLFCSLIRSLIHFLSVKDNSAPVCFLKWNFWILILSPFFLFFFKKTGLFLPAALYAVGLILLGCATPPASVFNVDWEVHPCAVLFWNQLEPNSQTN